MDDTRTPSEPLLLRSQQMHHLAFHASRKRQPVFFVIALFLAVIGITVWILNIVGSIPGPWSSIFGAIFAVLGVALALPQRFPSSSDELSGQTAALSGSQLDQSSNFARLIGDSPDTDKSKGALIVFVKKYLRGSTVNLCRGFVNVDLKIDAAQSVVRRRMHVPLLFRFLGVSSEVYVAVFPQLEPGNYTVYTESQEFKTRVGIYAGQVTEVDWR